MRHKSGSSGIRACLTILVQGLDFQRGKPYSTKRGRTTYALLGQSHNRPRNHSITEVKTSKATPTSEWAFCFVPTLCPSCARVVPGLFFDRPEMTVGLLPFGVTVGLFWRPLGGWPKRRWFHRPLG